MGKRVFVSYSFRDRALVHNLQTLLQGSPAARDMACVFVEGLGPNPTGAQVESEIAARMRTANAVVFAVGDESHNSSWIAFEVAEASRCKLRSVAVRVPGTTGGVPNALKGHVAELVEWDGNALAGALIRVVN